MSVEVVVSSCLRMLSRKTMAGLGCKCLKVQLALLLQCFIVESVHQDLIDS